MARKTIEEYSFSADMVPVKVSIVADDNENVPVYDIEMPEISKGTAALLDALSDELIGRINFSTDALDLEKAEANKKHAFLQIKELLSKKLSEIKIEEINTLSGFLLHKLYGLGFVDVIMSDNWLEELAINGTKSPVSVYHKKHGWCKTTKFLQSNEEIYNYAAQIGRKAGKEITLLHPIMDAHLLSGDRATATLYPVSTSGNTITIRRFARNPWSPVTLMEPKVATISKEMLAFLWQAVQYELNIIIGGGTASGKTSMLNALCSFMLPNQRIISIEDTREIALPGTLEWGWVPMTTRTPNPEGQGEVTMLDLMVSSLRMRPDRIIVGEIRKREQAETLFEAMHTGHSVCSTMHADTTAQIIRRLIEPPMQIPKTEMESLQLVLVQYRDRRKGIRRALELAEILTGDELQINYLYRYRPRTDSFEKVNESIRCTEELNLHTGMTPEEIKQDLKEKETILQWMLDNRVRSIHDIGKVTSIYYKDPALIMEAASKNKKPDAVLK